MAKRVKRLELNFQPRGAPYGPRWFPYYLRRYPGAPLTSLELNEVHVTGNYLEQLLHDYPTLESLSVAFSESVLNLKVAGPALKIKSLKIRGCFKMNHLEISAPNLISFDYMGSILSCFPLISTPKLAELSISGDYGDHFLCNFMGLSSIFSQIELLRLEGFIPLMGDISKKFPVGPRLKMLDISTCIVTEEELYALCSLVQACPLLQKFALQIDVMCEIHTLTEKRKEVCPPHHHLKIVEMIGSVGCEAEFRFAEYLTENAASLEKIIIKPDSSCKEPVEEFRIRVAKRLCSFLKPGVHLEIL